MTQTPSDQALEPVSNCQNCNAPLQGEYCHQCGQQNKNVVRFFPTLLSEAFDGLFSLDSRSYLTIWRLFSRPAFLSNEYLSGRRARYLPPVRLFLVFIVIIIFTISVQLFFSSYQQSLNQTEVTNSPEQTGNLENVPVEPVEITDEADETGSENQVEEIVTFLTEFIDTLQFPILTEQQNLELLDYLKLQTEANVPEIAEDPRDYVRQMLEYLPFLMLLLIPLLAMVQQIAYLGSGRYYIEHLVLTIHNQSFVFLAFILDSLFDLPVNTNNAFIAWIGNLANSLLGLWVVIYLYLSLKFFFRQGYFVTFIKYAVISVIYGACLFAGFLGIMVFGFFTY